MKFFSKHDGITINLSTPAITRIIGLVVATILLLRFFGHIEHQLELIGVSAFLAVALNPAVTAITKRLHIKWRILATAISYVIVLGLLISFLSFVIPPLVKQTSSFLHEIPHTVNNLKDQNSAVGRVVKRYHLQGQIDNLSGELGSKLNQAPSLLFSAASRVGGVLVSILTILVLTFMMLIEGPLWLKRLWAITPAHKRDDYQEVAAKMYRVITGYVNGQVFIAALASAFSFTALLIATHVTHTSVNEVALAGIVFLFGLVPLIGNTLAAIIVVTVCLFASPGLALIMLIYFPVYQQIENTTLQPHIQAKNNQLTPLLVFMSALVGAGFGGLLGAFVAIPAAGCLRILLEYRYGEKLIPTKEAVDRLED